MDTPVNSAIALKLYAKGIKFECDGNFYSQDGELRLCQKHSPRWEAMYSGFRPDIPAPSIATVVMRLYSQYGIWVAVTLGLGATLTFCYHLIGERTSGTWKAYFKTPTEAYEAAIEYTLDHLIN